MFQTKSLLLFFIFLSLFAFPCVCWINDIWVVGVLVAGLMLGCFHLNLDCCFHCALNVIDFSLYSILYSFCRWDERERMLTPLAHERGIEIEGTPKTEVWTLLLDPIDNWGCVWIQPLHPITPVICKKSMLFFESSIRLI